MQPQGEATNRAQPVCRQLLLLLSHAQRGPQPSTFLSATQESWGNTCPDSTGSDARLWGQIGPKGDGITAPRWAHAPSALVTCRRSFRTCLLDVTQGGGHRVTAGRGRSHCTEGSPWCNPSPQQRGRVSCVCSPCERRSVRAGWTGQPGRAPLFAQAPRKPDVSRTVSQHSLTLWAGRWGRTSSVHTTHTRGRPCSGTAVPTCDSKELVSLDHESPRRKKFWFCKFTWDPGAAELGVGRPREALSPHPQTRTGSCRRGKGAENCSCASRTRLRNPSQRNSPESRLDPGANADEGRWGKTPSYKLLLPEGQREAAP